MLDLTELSCGWNDRFCLNSHVTFCMDRITWGHIPLFAGLKNAENHVIFLFHFDQIYFCWMNLWRLVVIEILRTNKLHIILNHFRKRLSRHLWFAQCLPGYVYIMNISCDTVVPTLMQNSNMLHTLDLHNIRVHRQVTCAVKHMQRRTLNSLNWLNIRRYTI